MQGGTSSRCVTLVVKMADSTWCGLTVCKGGRPKFRGGRGAHPTGATLEGDGRQDLGKVDKARQTLGC